ncbi:hypothetical protein U1839_01975 [Sphingomonas sp. RT2P30]|uniref:hypothetical protein n=1 Tax=Parasphingomonas halimpatiens TaxID=3096162 RepID=UPI002FC8F5C3
MVQSSQPASSSWIAVPRTLRVAWNDVDPDEMFRIVAPARQRRFRSRISGLRDCAYVSCLIAPLLIRDRFRRMIVAITHNRPRIYKLTSIRSPAAAQVWRVEGAIGSEKKSLSFSCVLQKDEGYFVCG